MDSKHIEAEAGRMLKKYNPGNKIPFPFAKLKDENFSVQYTDEIFKEVLGPEPSKKTSLWEHLAGVLFYSEKIGARVYINDELPPRTVYFSIAVLLGHYLLHKEKLDKEKDILFQMIDASIASPKFDSEENRKLVNEAKYFAYCLLLPEVLVKRGWQKLNDVDQLAELFNVSTHAMANRLKELKLIDP